MENPITTVKESLSVSKIVGFVVAALVVFALLDLAGLTTWILQPISTAKAKFGSANTPTTA
jgi:hypothetical protein